MTGGLVFVRGRISAAVRSEAGKYPRALAYPRHTAHLQVPHYAERQGVDVRSEERACKEPARPDLVERVVEPPHLLDLKERELCVVIPTD